MNGRTATANDLLQTLAAWLVATPVYLAGFPLTAMWIATLSTGLFFLHYLCITFFRHAE